MSFEAKATQQFERGRPLRRLRMYDGHCAYCDDLLEKFDDGPVTAVLDDEVARKEGWSWGLEFCGWKCLSDWAADHARAQTHNHLT